MDAQAQDRCHRIGQTRDVHIYRLVSVVGGARFNPLAELGTFGIFSQIKNDFFAFFL